MRWNDAVSASMLIPVQLDLSHQVRHGPPRIFHSGAIHSKRLYSNLVGNTMPYRDALGAVTDCSASVKSPRSSEVLAL
jgi:hypothetical protein